MSNKKEVSFEENLAHLETIVKELESGTIPLDDAIHKFNEAMKIAKHIMNGESVLVNFHQIQEYQARRIVDFLTGTVYAENGDIKRVGNEIFLCTAQGVEIDGTAQSLMDANMLEIQ